MEWLNPKLRFRKDRPFSALVRAYAVQLHGHREMISRSFGWSTSHFSAEELEHGLSMAADLVADAKAESTIELFDDLRRVHQGGPTPLIAKQRLASKFGDPVEVDVDHLARELFQDYGLLRWQEINDLSSCGLLVVAWERSATFRSANENHPLWQFFRHVRNAAGHDAKLSFWPGQPSHPAIWRQHELQQHMNGQPLFRYPPADGLLSPGDCLHLLSDVETTLMP